MLCLPKNVRTLLKIAGSFTLKYSDNITKTIILSNNIGTFVAIRSMKSNKKTITAKMLNITFLIAFAAIIPNKFMGG